MDVVVCMDTNAKNPLWGGNVLDERGECVELVLRELGWMWLNDGVLPTFANFRGSSFIDLTVVSASLSMRVSGWCVKDGWTTCAHRVLVFELKGSGCSERLRYDRGRLRMKGADWDKFRECLRERVNEMSKCRVNCRKDVVEMVRKVEGWVYEAAGKAIPRGVRRARAVCWWSRELDDCKKKLVRMRREWQRERVESERERMRCEYGRARSQYKAKLRAAKKHSWKTFVEEQEEKGPWNLVYKMATNKVRPERVMDVIGENEGVIDWNESGLRLLNGLVPDDCAEDETDYHTRVRAENECYVPEFGERWSVSESDVKEAVWMCKNGKTPGWDGVTAEMLKEGWEIAAVVWTRMYEVCVKYRVFPNRWKWGRVCALLKGEDKDPGIIKSYRPICLLPVMGKILERIIVKKMEDIFYESIHGMQFGFMRGRSCEDAMNEMRRVVDTSPSKYVMGVFLDVSGAFDRVWWPSVMRCMREKGVNKEAYELLNEFLSERKVEMNVGMGVVRKVVNMGCPQGSVLGPQVWKLLFDGCVRSVNEAGWRMIAFADDGVVLVCGESRREMEVSAGRMLRVIDVWMKENKMRLSVEKTVCMMLKGRLKGRYPVVRMAGSELNWVKVVRYLGVEWEENMRIQRHVVNVCERAARLTNNVLSVYGRACVQGVSWIEWLYKGLFLAIATYGAGAWGDLLNTWTRRRLRTGHRRVLLRMVRTYRTVSQAALEVLAGQWPLELEVERRWASYHLRKQGEVVWRGRRLTGVRRRGELRNVCLDEWQNEWSKTGKGEWTREWFPDVRERVKMTWVNVDYCLAQILSGHGVFKGKLFGYGLCEYAWCDCEEEEEQTVKHVVDDCVMFESERMRLIEGLNEAGLEWTRAGCVSEQGFALLKEFARVVIGELEEREKRACLRT